MNRKIIVRNVTDRLTEEQITNIKNSFKQLFPVRTPATPTVSEEEEVTDNA